MNHKKLQTYSLKRSLIGIVAIVSLLTAIMIPSTVRAATNDCSDVYTPLSSFVSDGVAANKSFYVQAMNETGVPWQMLAAIHYRETNFSHTNPSNGQGIFQFVNADGGPYPPGPVDDTEFYRQLKFMANEIQTDYVYRNTPNPANVKVRKLVADEQDINLVKNTLYSYNGRSTAYANQGAQYGYDPATQPYEGSPYVMNRFDCPRARMGIITQDYGTIDGTDTRYGTFTLFARLHSDDYWKLLTVPYSWILLSQEAYSDSSRSLPVNLNVLAPGQKVYMRITARNFGNTTWTNTGNTPVNLSTSGPDDRISPFCDTTTWLTCSRPATLKEASVAPGQIGTFEFVMKAPDKLGQYNEYFNLVAEGVTRFNNFGLYYQLNVTKPTDVWQPVSQAAFGDQAHTLPIDTHNLAPNTSYYMQLKIRNFGNTTWSNTGANPVNLGTSGPRDRKSPFCDTTTWLTCSRPATLKEASVAPGQIGTFEFVMKAPSSYSDNAEYFTPVKEGVGWLQDLGLFWPMNVKQPTYAWQYLGQSLYTDSTKSTKFDPTSTVNNSTAYAVLKVRNTGNTTWSNTGANPVNLGTSGPRDRKSPFCDTTTWLTCSRPATLKEASVAPGQIGTFEFVMKAPYAVNGTSYKEYFNLVAEGVNWMNDLGQYYQFTMNSPLYVWQYVDQGVFSDAATTKSVNPTNLSKNTTYYLRLHARNISGQTWSNQNTNLGTSNPQDRTSAFYDSSWLNQTRPTKLKETSIAPGQVGTFIFAAHTPMTSGTYNEYFNLVTEGKSWMNDLGLYWPLTVN